MVEDFQRILGREPRSCAVLCFNREEFNQGWTDQSHLPMGGPSTSHSGGAQVRWPWPRQSLTEVVVALH